MGDFRRKSQGSYSGRSSSRSSFGGRDRDSGRDRGSRRNERGPIEMHEVICSKCGIKTEVPFKPTGDKPVYCRECFDKNSLNRGSDRSSSSGAGISQEQFSQLNAKLDKILELLETLEIEYDEDEEEDEKE